MRSFSILLAAVFAAVLSGTAFASPQPLIVTVNDNQGNLLEDVTVAAVNFGVNGPSTHSVFGLTDSSGVAGLPLEQGVDYELFVSTQGYSPTLADQFNNPDPSAHIHLLYSGTQLTRTVTLAPGLSGVGRIVLPFKNATPSEVLFGSVNNSALQQPVAFGITQALPDNTGTLIVDNVPYASAGTYNIGAYDPQLNSGIGQNVDQDLNGSTPVTMGAPTLAYSQADFNYSVPPTRADNTAAQNGGASGLSVQGVVQDTAAAVVPNMGIGFQYCYNGNYNNIWTNTDQNGSFQLYGLLPGVTYYAQVYGGCTWTPTGPGACYAPYSSPALSGGSLDCTTPPSVKGQNDFVYYSSASVQYQILSLSQMPPSSGQIKVYVKDSSGHPIPQGNVGLSPDGSLWSNNGCSGAQSSTTTFSSPGFSNANIQLAPDGSAVFSGLPSGNYVVNAWTPFSQNGANGPVPFNAGPDQQFVWGSSEAHCGTDDLRVAVDTDPATNAGSYLHVYNSSGTDLGMSAIDVAVNTGGNATGSLTGTLRFSQAADLTKDPMMITLSPICGPSGCQGQGNFTVVGSSGSPSYTYDIPVTSGTAYNLNVNSRWWAWARTNGGNNTVDLSTGTGSAVMDMNFVPGGVITGTVYKPDGTVYTPGNNIYVWINADADQGWAGAQLSKDGTFEIDGAMPGVNQLSLNINGNSLEQYTLPFPDPVVTVVAGSTATLNLNLRRATYLGATVDMTKLPVSYFEASGSGDAVYGFSVLPLPSGSLFTHDELISVLNHKGGDNNSLSYSPPVAPNAQGPCGNGWTPNGFCAVDLPSPAVYDLYLVRNGDFSDMSVSNPPYPYFTVFGSTRNVVLNDSRATAPVPPKYMGGQTVNGVSVDMTPSSDLSSRGNATLAGSVTATNFFRQADYAATGGDFNKFLNYLPVVSLYNSSGTLKAAGLVVPSPSYIQQHNAEFSADFALGYQKFSTLLNSAGGFGFGIQDLPPGACYTAVVTTPNYPPYQTRRCLGAPGSTTTLNIDLDTAVGYGASLSGVVSDTGTVPMPNVLVTVSVPGMQDKAAVTGSSGTYEFDGLPAGTVKVKASFGGYASAEADVGVNGSGTAFTQDLTLTYAPGSITGTVYSQKLPFAKVQPGAQIYAYDDTYNGTHTDSPLPLIKTKTGPDGSYTLTGLVPGDTYKVFLSVPGKYVLDQSVTAATSAVSGADFTMLPKPLDIELFAKQGESYYDFTVLNPQDFKSGAAYWCEAPYSSCSSPAPLQLNQLSSGELFGQIPLSLLTPGHTYVLHGEATSLTNQTVVKEITFGLGVSANASQNIDDAILGDDSDNAAGRGNNEAPVDPTGTDPSALQFPAGALLPVSTGAIPSCAFSSTDKNDPAVSTEVASVGADAIKGNLYNISLSSVVVNQNKGFDVTLAYDKSAVTDPSGLAVAQYNSATDSWEKVPGLAAIDPLSGTIKVRLKSLTSVLAAGRRTAAPLSVFNGHEYVVSAPAGASVTTSGTFTVLESTAVGAGGSVSTVKVYNFPNPFNLESKTLATRYAGSMTTNGTIISVEVPAGNGGPGHIRIYTLSGELVRDISISFTAGAYNYVTWDGRNKDGSEVANGVYYGFVSFSGNKPGRKHATFKMAVIK